LAWAGNVRSLAADGCVFIVIIIQREQFCDTALAHQQLKAAEHHARPKPRPHECEDGETWFSVTRYNLHSALCVSHGHIPLTNLFEVAVRLPYHTPYLASDTYCRVCARR
jgi:hypothetical protein